MVLENKIEKRLREINHNDDYNDNVNVKNKTNKRKQNKKKEKKKQRVGFMSKTTALHVFFSSLTSTARLGRET